MNLFESRLLIEGVRAVEGESAPLSTYRGNDQTASFESLLLQRAKSHQNSAQISALFSHFTKISQHFYTLSAALIFLFGAIAVNKVLFTEQITTVNFFWAFALFFIPNFLMLFVWLWLFCKPLLLQSSSLSRLSLITIHFFESKFNKVASKGDSYIALFNCYFSHLFGKQVGRYQLSKLTHLLWLSYFTGAILMSVLMLATHQVDFVWQTSILSSESFQNLTQLLAFLPQKMGFPVPSIEQIQQSYLGTSDLLDAENRRLVWSSLLISSLLLYGLLPRLCLYLLMSYLLNKQKKIYQLDLSQSYYVQLRQLLKPNKTTLGITDPDIEKTNSSFQLEEATVNFSQVNSLPDDFYPVAIELSDSQYEIAKEHRALLTEAIEEPIINVCDYQQQVQILATLKSLNSRTIVLYVALKRIPDRGMKRFINQLTSLPGCCFYLALIVENKANKQRDSDWYHLAKEVQIQLDNIVHIEDGTSHNE